MIYYVDNIIGDDENDGKSQEKPFKTTSKINSLILKPGTKVLFKAGGIWNAPLKPSGSGAEGEFIEFDSYGEGQNPIINANGKQSAIEIRNMSFVKVSNFEVTNIDDDYEKSRIGVYVTAGEDNTQGGKFKDIYINNINAHDICTVADRWAGGIIVVAHMAKNPVTFENLHIENCQIKNTNAQGITFASEYSSRVGIDWAQGEFVPSENIIIKNNYIENCGGDGIFQNCAINPMIERNTVTNTSWAGNTAYAGIWPHNSINPVMQFNEAYGQKLVGGDGQGYDVDIDCENTKVQYNFSHHNEGGFLLLCTSGDQGGFNNDITVRYNVSEDDSGQIFTLSGPIKDIKIYNNTVSVKEGLNTRLIGMYQWGDTGGGPDDVFIENNIFNMNTAGKNQFYPDTKFEFSNNLCFGTYDFTDIKSKTTIFDNPKFIKNDTAFGITNGLNFKLKKDSKGYKAVKPFIKDDTVKGNENINIGAIL